MKRTMVVAVQWAVVGAWASSLIACGVNSAQKSSSRGGQQDAAVEQLANEYLGDCPKLTGSPAQTPIQTPVQNPVQTPVQTPTQIPGKVPAGPGQLPPGKVVIVPTTPAHPVTPIPVPELPTKPGTIKNPCSATVAVPPKSCVDGLCSPVIEPVIPCKSGSCTQTPIQNPGCTKNCAPTGGEPQPFPPQPTIEDNKCGKLGSLCDNGGPGQYPTSDIRGKVYDRADVDACFDAFRRSGYDTQGMWQIEVHQVTSIFGNRVFESAGRDPKLVIINSVGVLGQMEFKLLNPNALYCMRNVSLFDQVRIASCYTHNVVFGQNVRSLPSADGSVVSCR